MPPCRDIILTGDPSLPGVTTEFNLAFPAHRLAGCAVSASLTPQRNFAGWIVF